jgi:hypothetical protein
MDPSITRTYKQIGDEPELDDLWMQHFYYEGKVHETLFHAVVNVPSSYGRHRAYLAYVEAVNKKGPDDSTNLRLRLELAFGVYAFQHRDKIMCVFHSVPTGTRFAIPGLHVDCRHDFLRDYYLSLDGKKDIACLGAPDMC